MKPVRQKAWWEQARGWVENGLLGREDSPYRVQQFGAQAERLRRLPEERVVEEKAVEPVASVTPVGAPAVSPIHFTVAEGAHSGPANDGGGGQGGQVPPVRADAKTRPGGSRPKLVDKNSGLVASNLGKRYGGRPVVRDISLTVQRGEAVGLLGPNGAGKTTSFYMITGLVRPDYGTISLDGHNITALPMYRRARLGIGYLPQEASIFRGLTVEQNIMAVLEVNEPADDVRRVMLDELLAEFSITHLRNAPAIALSGGERRRVEIARALASRPSFILLDEPLAGIDPIAVGEVRAIVSHLKDRGIGVLITDHNVRETLDIIDRAYIIHEGTVLIEGKPGDIVNNADVRRVYLGERFSL